MLPDIKAFVNANLAELLIDAIIFLVVVFAAAIGLAGGAE